MPWTKSHRSLSGRYRYRKADSGLIEKGIHAAHAEHLGDIPVGFSIAHVILREERIHVQKTIWQHPHFPEHTDLMP
jgi:hypothetical protein